MKTWTQGHLDVSGCKLRYFRSGGDLPPLVFVHGFTDSAVYFTRAAQALSERWDVVAYDARGHGASDRAIGAFDDQPRVNDLVAVVEQLDLERPAMIGHSMGAATIVQAVAVHHGLSRAAVLEDPAWAELTDDEVAALRGPRIAGVAEWRRWVESLQQAAPEAALAQRLRDEPAWCPIDVEAALEGRREFQLDLFDHFPQDRSPWQHLVRSITCPVLLLTGDNRERGAIVSWADAQHAVALNPLLEHVQVAGAGHHIKYDCFDAYLGAASGFLDRFA